MLLLTIYLASRFRVARPEQVLIVTGAGLRGEMLMLKSGGKFVWPLIQRADYLSLQVHTFEVTTPEVYTSDGIPVSVTGAAQIKVKSDMASIAVAAEHFLGRQAETMERVAVASMEGRLKEAIAVRTMETVYKQREEIAADVRQTLESDLSAMGLELKAFTIVDVHDNSGYLDAVGMPNIAALKKEAGIAKALAERDEQIAKAKALEESQKAEFAAETGIAEAAKEMEVKKTQFWLESQMRKAEAEEAIRLQELMTANRIKEEEWAAQLTEKEKLNELEAKELERRERHNLSLKRIGIDPAELEKTAEASDKRSHPFDPFSLFGKTESAGSGAADKSGLNGKSEPFGTSAATGPSDAGAKSEAAGKSERTGPFDRSGKSEKPVYGKKGAGLSGGQQADGKGDLT